MANSTLEPAARKVLIGPVRYDVLCTRGRQMLVEAGFELIENAGERPYTFDDLKPHLGEIFGAVSGLEEWTDNVFELAPNLRVIGRLGVGLDNVDLESATRHRIAVTNVPGGNANAVAELAIGLMLAVQRKIPVMGRDIRNGVWDRYLGYELAGKTLGLVGFGAIAQLLARRLAGFDMNVIAFDPFANQDVADELGVRIDSLENVLGAADIVSVHAPHTSSTHHMVNAGTLSLMQEHAILINTSRGGLVDESALFEALQERKIAGAGLDVWENEPVAPSNPLLLLDTVAATTHAAADSAEAYETVGIATAQAIIDVANGHQPQNLRNASALPHPCLEPATAPVLTPRRRNFNEEQP